MTSAAELDMPIAESIHHQRDETLSYAVDIQDLSKSFRRQTLARSGYTTIKSSLLSLFRRRSTAAHNVTHVIKDLTLRIPKGSSVGIIGRNGSGKSSLLKLITGIYKPDHGRIKVNGRVAALIELGAGFHPDFTGRENLYLGGIMLGLTRAEIDARFEEIVDFAELAQVIDDPVRTYSSGMFMRLGFSLAVHTDPDVLLVDEVLAVGDASFVAKCKDRIALLRKHGKTLVLVTHDLDAVERWCDEVLWINQGIVKDRGHPRRVIDHYRQFIEWGEERELKEAMTTAAATPPPVDEVPVADYEDAHDETEIAQRWGSREIEISSVSMLGADGQEQLVFHPNDAAQIVIKYHSREIIGDAVFGIGINRSDGLAVYGTNTDIERVELPALGSAGIVRCDISRLGLLEGTYFLDVAVHKMDGYPFDYHKNAVKFAVRSSTKEIGVCSPVHEWKVLAS